MGIDNSNAKCIILVMETQITLEAFRAARNWSQARLAHELGVDQATISRWENAPETPRKVQLALAGLASRKPQQRDPTIPLSR